MAATDNWSFISGDDVLRVYLFTESDGTTPVDLTGRTFACQMRLNPPSPEFFAFTCTVADPSSGEVAITMASAVTVTIPPATYVFDLNYTLEDLVTTPIGGQIRVFEGITR